MITRLSLPAPSVFHREEAATDCVRDPARVSIRPLQEGRRLGLCIEPGSEEIDLASWAAGHRDWIESRLLKHGALLFHGFAIRGAADFKPVAAAVGCSRLHLGAEIESVGNTDVYSRAKESAEQTQPFHNVGACSDRYPLRLAYLCDRAAEQGGEIALADGREVCRIIDSRVLDRFRREGLLYVRNLLPGVDVGWQSMFRTSDRLMVEGACSSAGLSWNWNEQDGLKISRRAPAVIVDARTGDLTFFSQLLLQHVSSLDPEVRASMLSVFQESGLPRNVYYGDGASIEDWVIACVSEAYWRSATAFRLAAGDVVIIDNLLAPHGRLPYTGAREMLVATSDFVRLPADRGSRR